MVPPCSCEPAAMTNCWANSGFTACFEPVDGDLSVAAGHARRSRHRLAACRSAIAGRRGGLQTRSPGIHRRQPARRTTPAAHAGDHATAVGPAGGTVREHRQTHRSGRIGAPSASPSTRTPFISPPATPPHPPTWDSAWAAASTPTGPSSKHAAAPSKPAPDKPTGSWRPSFQSMATGKTCIRRPAMSSNRMTAYSRRIAPHFG